MLKMTIHVNSILQSTGEVWCSADLITSNNFNRILRRECCGLDKANVVIQKNALKGSNSYDSGHAIAGGCGLASLCDFSIASQGATFGYSEVKIGFIPAIVSVFFLEKWKTKELLLSGKRY